MGCLKDWLNTKKIRKPNRVASCFTWKVLECELCKVKFPDYINYKGKIYELLDLEKPDNPYMVLELISASNSHTAAKSFHVVSLAENK